MSKQSKMSKQALQYYLGKHTVTDTTVSIPPAYNYSNWFKKGLCCSHKGESPVLTFGDTRIHACERRYIDKSATLCLDLTGYSKSLPLEVPMQYAELLIHTWQQCPTIYVNWDDGSTPPVTFSFWSTLLRLLPPGKVIISCLGAHGRTGTALAALAIVGHKWTAKQAIAEIRRIHCKEAIETQSQEKYLERLAAWHRQDFDR